MAPKAVNKNLTAAQGVRSRVFGEIVFLPNDETPSVVRSDLKVASIARQAEGVYRITLSEVPPENIEFGQPSLQHTSLVDAFLQVGTWTRSTGVLDILAGVASTGAAGDLAAGTVRVPLVWPEFKDAQ